LGFKGGLHNTKNYFFETFYFKTKKNHFDLSKFTTGRKTEKKFIRICCLVALKNVSARE
jgi:hypothetical protein